MPVQMQVGKIATSANSLNTTGEMSTGKFGSVLASLTGIEGMQEQPIEELASETDLLAELLQITTADELKAFLQENGYEQNELFEVIDDHFLFHDENIIELLAEIFPTFDALSHEVSGESVAIDMRELFILFEEMGEEMFMKMEQNELPENLSKDELIMLLAVMQMTAIEGPKVDLTGKQEQQLHALQEMMKNLGKHLSESSQKGNQNQTLPFQDMSHITKLTNEAVAQPGQEAKPSTNETLTRPVQEGQPLTKITNESIGQSNFSITAGVGLENVKAEGDVQRSSRAEVLLQELQNIFKRANLGQTGGTNRISIKLYPEHLGQLRIELLQTNGLLTARILASNALGKEMLESQLHQLRQAFLQQNIQVERIDISQMLTETPHHERDHAFNQHFKQQQEETNEQSTHENEEETMSFNEYMIELEG